MEIQPEPLPQAGDDLQEWYRTFAENNQEIQELMVEALKLLEEQNQQRNAAGTH